MHGNFLREKLLFVGPPNGGMTSWIALFQGQYYIYFNKFKVMLSRKDFFQLLDCVFRVL